MLAAVLPFALERGLLPAGRVTTARILTLNTGMQCDVTVQTPGRPPAIHGDARIDGVPGTAAPITINFLDTAGSVCPSLLPSGRVLDASVGGAAPFEVEATLIDNGMPMVLVRAADFGMSGYETVAELNANERAARANGSAAPGDRAADGPGRRHDQKLSPDHRLPRPLHHRAQALEEWRNKQIAGIKDAGAGPKVSELKISDDELRETIDRSNQLRLMKERGNDLTLFSPRASFMAHHIGDFRPAQHLGRDLQRAVLPRVAAVPGSLRRPAMLPQSPGVDPPPASRAGEVRQGIRHGRHQPEPGPVGRPLDLAAADDRHWYPIYEKMVEYDIPAMIHVSTSCNPASTPPARTT
jgi:hypothetical protein